MTRSSTRRATIMEVARLAGVSHQTVSRYLKFNGEGLKPVTRERVEAAIDELNYRPNLLARSMRTRTTGRVAVLIPTPAFNPARMLAGATSAAHEAGYSVEVISPEGGAAARTDRILELADTRQVDGIVSLSPVHGARIEELASDIPVVVSEDFDDEMRSIGVLADAAPVTEMVTHLAELGHRRFFHVSGSAQFASARARAEVFRESVERLRLENVGVHEGDWTGESGIEAVRSLPARGAPTAIIAANDLVAAGVMRGAVERGWDVPGDVSVTGWDNNQIGLFMTPSLTTVDVNLEQIGARAMTRLIATLRDEEPRLDDEPLNRIIWRESTAAPR
ncbi:LacI family DNA-binding transcriptional regulator [Myceligenerans pegani]|uniref:LacI family DNA-binding transcriptional regulator n=1 Tax=Myceligenerans pegani TaxID=2776917 RepID=UPI00299DE89D|nr:LacI family DNA-binding transcriptional regulator [Myceligenerans sp. TRM 65318]